MAHDPPTLAPPLLAMVHALNPEEAAELADHAAAHLARGPHRRAARWDELGLLATMILASRAGGDPTGYVSQVAYEAQRAADGPSASRLAKSYGDWRWALRAADGLQPDGRTRGAGAPWPNTGRGAPRHAAYTEAEVAAALRAYIAAHGRLPTVNRYEDWARRERATARKNGGERKRLPSAQSIYRLHESWPSALAQLARGGSTEGARPS